MTKTSQSGILIFLNGAPITWYSKLQNKVEASNFGLEFIALRVDCKMKNEFRYKLRLMGVPFKGHTNVYCDNEVVVGNFSIIESTLTKKHLSSYYHKTCEWYVKGAIHIGYEHQENNCILKSQQVIINTRRSLILYIDKCMHNFNFIS